MAVREPARRFQATEQTTYRDLASTMRKLGATSLRVPRDLLDAKNATAEIVFDRAGKRYVVRCAKWKLWADNFRAAERVIMYLYRAVDEYGVTTDERSLGDAFGQFFAGFEATPDDRVLLLGDGTQAWWDTLGVSQAATKAEIVNAFRALARTHHPDAGGDPQDFIRLRRAYDQALADRIGKEARR